MSVKNEYGVLITIAVVVPAYKCKDKIISVLNRIPSIVDNIIVVDDCSPDLVGQEVISKNIDQRVKVIINKQNLGVGGAVLNGYQEAIKLESHIIVKIDGDGQMNPEIISNFIIVS
jgi:glycosyltransferase involved in cell wall biosynthesis